MLSVAVLVILAFPVSRSLFHLFMDNFFALASSKNFDFAVDLQYFFWRHSAV